MTLWPGKYSGRGAMSTFIRLEACQLDQERVDYDISSRPRRAGVNLERQPHQLVHRRVAKAVGWAGGAPRHTVEGREIP